MMRNTHKKRSIWCFAILISALPLLAQAKTYVVGIEPAFPPWAFVQNGQYQGIAADAVRAMAKQQGFNVKFKSLPFSSLIPALLAKKIDILATALTVSKKRAQKIAFTVPWWRVNMDVLVPKDSDKNIVTALCCGQHVGTMSATTDINWLKNHLGDKIKLRGYPEATTAIHDLKIGRLDTVVLDDNPARGFQKKNSDSIRIAGTIDPYPPQVYALGVRKGDKKLLALLNKAEVHLYKSGKWAEIIHKYLPGASIDKVPEPMSSEIPSYKKPIPGLSQSQ
jgi:polar amino acid transport system substrate-binding protein